MRALVRKKSFIVAGKFCNSLMRYLDQGKTANGAHVAERCSVKVGVQWHPYNLGTEWALDLKKIPTSQPKVREIYKRYQVYLFLAFVDTIS